MNRRHKQVYYKVFKKCQRDNAFRRYGHIDIETMRHFKLRNDLLNHAKDYILKVTVLNG